MKYVDKYLISHKVSFSMPRPLIFSASAPAAVKQAARDLGRRLRLARVRRRLSQRELASRAGISYVTMRAIEAGSLLTGLGAYLAAIWALGLERELVKLLDPDTDAEGKQLELSRTPRRARAQKGSTRADF
jgi:transcriptional regulator with XRE-family HTH domain